MPKYFFSFIGCLFYTELVSRHMHDWIVNLLNYSQDFPSKHPQSCFSFNVGITPNVVTYCFYNFILHALNGSHFLHPDGTQFCVFSFFQILLSEGNLSSIYGEQKDFNFFSVLTIFHFVYIREKSNLKKRK